MRKKLYLSVVLALSPCLGAHAQAVSSNGLETGSLQRSPRSH